MDFSTFRQIAGGVLAIKWCGVVLFIVILLLSCESPELSSSSEKIKEQIVDTNIVVTLPVKRGPEPEVISIDYDTSEWSELRLEDDILLDLRYSTTNNFVKEKLYDCPRCFLRPEVANALLKAQVSLAEKNLRFKLFDCYRPRQIQERLWEKVPNPSYVTSPRKGSMHNRGSAIDLTLVDEKGEELDMGTEFDFFGVAAHHTYEDLPAKILKNRRLLRSVMAKHGFRSIRTEWWHYSYRGPVFSLDTMLWPCEEL